jgi:hypothetical protein
MLAFAPAAWLKLMFFLHAGETEVGGFALTAAHDPLYVEDFVTVRQYATAATVAFDDAAVADHFDRCVDAGLKPESFARIWVHTHPGESPEPSTTDERTFARVFGRCDWALMFIVGRTGRTYARLGFRAGPGGQAPLDVVVDWEAWPQAVLEDPGLWGRRLLGWAEEYARNVHPAAAAAWSDGAAADATGAGALGMDAEQDEATDWWDLQEEDYSGADLADFRPAAGAWAGRGVAWSDGRAGAAGGEVPA